MVCGGALRKNDGGGYGRDEQECIQTVEEHGKTVESEGSSSA